MDIKVYPIRTRLAVAYLVEINDGFILVDCGGPDGTRRILDVLKDRPLRLIYLTHAHLDHCGSAADLKRITSAPVAIHRLDAEDMALGITRLGSARGRGRLVKLLWPAIRGFMRPEPVVADILLEDGDSLEPLLSGARIIHTPGHTPGSTCLLLDDRLAFVGDLISATRKPHLQRYYAVDWSELPGSLRRLQASNPNWVYPGHGSNPLTGEVLQALRA